MKIQLYLGGDRLLFGLPATPAASPPTSTCSKAPASPGWQPSSAATSSASGIAALAIEKGGHVRVGLEDHHAPPRLARNDELVAEVAALCRAAGRPPATVEEAPKILFG